MNYAWEVVLEADKNLIPRENIRFHPVNNGSPYTGFQMNFRIFLTLIYVDWSVPEN